MWSADNFSYFGTHVFHALQGVFWEQEFFILMKFNFSLSFDGLDLGIENSSQTLGPDYVLGFILKVLSFTFYFSSLVHSKLISFFLMFQICSSINQERHFPPPSIIFTFQGCYRLFKFTFGHWVNFCVIFIEGVRLSLVHFLLMDAQMLLHCLLERLSVFHWIACVPLSKISWLVYGFALCSLLPSTDLPAPCSLDVGSSIGNLEWSRGKGCFRLQLPLVLTGWDCALGRWHRVALSHSS